MEESGNIMESNNDNRVDGTVAGSHVLKAVNRSRMVVLAVALCMTAHTVWGEDNQICVDCAQNNAYYGLLGMMAAVLSVACIVLVVALIHMVRMRRKTEAEAEAKTQFIASISHEIRTPLAAIIGFSDLLKDDAVDSETRRKYLDSISVSAEALMKFVNDVLDLSKLEGDKMHMEVTATDFKKLGEDSMGIFAYRADQKHTTLETKIEQMPTLYIDPLRVRQIIFNLIGNALKYTEKGSVVLYGDFDNGIDGFGTLSFRVVDTGSGMDESQMERLLRPSEAISKLRGSNIVDGDTGLGMTITKRLIERMGGGLFISSTVGRGSTFEVRIPHVRYSLDLEDMLEEESESEDKYQVTSEIKSILLVDDVEMNLKVMSAICRRAGVERIETAKSGPDALEKLETLDVDLILTDLWMPGMSGVEFTEAVRKIPRLHGIPVIALTADVEAKDESHASVFDEIMFKPVTYDKIKALMTPKKLGTSIGISAAKEHSASV